MLHEGPAWSTSQRASTVIEGAGVPCVQPPIIFSHAASQETMGSPGASAQSFWLLTRQTLPSSQVPGIIAEV